LKKLHSLDRLAKILQAEKRKGKRIVLANGCFDLIHVGHVRYLKEAKKQGDILVVALNSDSSVSRLKGKGRPILKEDERAEILASFYFVNYLVLFDEDNVERILLSLLPHVHAKGSDYSEDTVPERETTLGYGGKIAITGGPKVRSTSDLLEVIKKKAKIRVSSEN
jgi:rfaE bifunctional protein nucleotidyltransferase chain/domain